MPNPQSINKLEITKSIIQRLRNMRSSLIDLVHIMLNAKKLTKIGREEKLQIFQSIKTSLAVLQFSANPLAHPFDRGHFYQTIRSTLIVIFQCVTSFVVLKVKGST